MPEPALKTLKATWDLSNDGYAEPNRRVLMALAVRLAAILRPGFAPAGAKQPISSDYAVDDYGGSLSTQVYRLGTGESSLEITDTVSSANDGMTPFEAGTTIQVGGLPDSYTLVLSGTFIAPLYGVPNPVRLQARLPEAVAKTVATLLRDEFGATIDLDD